MGLPVALRVASRTTGSAPNNRKKSGMSKSTSIRARLALLSLVFVMVACAEDPTSPGVTAIDLTPALAVAELAPVSALEGTPTAFYCGTSSDAEGDPLTCQWDFANDGLFEAVCTTSDGICRWDLNHDGLYEGSRAGSFDYSWPDQTNTHVRLVVTDSNGEQSTTTVPVTVADVVPYFWGREPLFMAVGQRQRFNTRMFDPGADGTWRWVFDFGDGSPTLTGRAVPTVGFGQFHTYDAPGQYDVTVTVTDKDGVTSSFTRVATVVVNEAPNANAGGPYTTLEGTPVLLTSAATTDDQSTLTFAWDFGDGTRSIAANPSKLYRDNGVFTVRLIATDPTGTADTAFTTVTVENKAPSGTPAIPLVREGMPYVIQLTGQDAPIDRATLQYQFDCGQGAGLTAWSLVNNVACPARPDNGTVTATYSIRDKDGASATYTRVITIQNAAPSLSLTATSATTIPVGGTVNVDARWSDLGVNDGPYTYRITWGDSPVATTGTTPGTMTTTPLAVSHTYTRAGTFLVTMFVTDKDGSTPRSNQIAVTVTP